MTGRAEDYERTMAFADIALGQLKALRQPAIPRNYEIWYAYATGFNPRLISSQRDAQGQGHDFRSRPRHRSTRIISANPPDRADRRSRQPGEGRDRSGHGDDRRRRGSASSYSESLAGATEKLGPSKDREGLRAIVESLVQTTKVHGASNHNWKSAFSPPSRKSTSYRKTSRWCVPKASPIRSPSSPTANSSTALEKAIADAVAH